MFEFNKRDTTAKSDELPDQFSPDNESNDPAPQAARPGARNNTGSEAAVIGPSIHIDGDLHGDEDLIIEGEVKGAVHLKNNSLTIGSKGKISADIYAHTIYVDGYMNGDLYGSERVSVRKTAQVQGNITSPRVSLEDGARFKGSIEMDPESEALKSAFSDSRKSGTATDKPAAATVNTGATGKADSSAAGFTAKPAATGGSNNQT
ncbi:MAG: polymer-forming cytoskeletal protein [Gammaproteobacteria bacterium]